MSGLDVERVARAVVRVEPAIVEGDDFSIVAFGSGSIVDRRGLILTNFPCDRSGDRARRDFDCGDRERWMSGRGRSLLPRCKWRMPRWIWRCCGSCRIWRETRSRRRSLNLTEIAQGDSSAVSVVRSGIGVRVSGHRR